MKTDREKNVESVRRLIENGNLEKGLETILDLFPAATHDTDALAEVKSLLELANGHGDVRGTYERLAKEELRIAKHRAGYGMLDASIRHIEEARIYAVCAGRQVSGEPLIEGGLLPPSQVESIYVTSYAVVIEDKLHHVPRAYASSVVFSENGAVAIKAIAREEAVKAAQAYLQRPISQEQRKFETFAQTIVTQVLGIPQA
ncbi:MAG: hypothetical protein Q7S65_04305 [Nanoarchaeota archaeon]|nr:hypothetical protein [Nanoarchaeota archaeon]